MRGPAGGLTAARGVHGAVLLALTLALACAALLKPALWDDVVYYDFARHILDHPFDPYGGTIRVFGRDLPAMGVTAPAFLLYWWAGAMALFGTEIGPSSLGPSSLGPSSLGLLPFAALYVVAVDALARRFAARVALPLTVVAALSPWALVSMSYMLDFPALALGLCALALFIHGCDRHRVAIVAAAGVIAGLALQTKYNMAAIPAAMLLYGALHRRYALAVLAAALAGVVFAGWEAVLWLAYGRSHFLLGLQGAMGGSAPGRYRQLLYGLVANLGPIALVVPLLATAALGASRVARIAIAAAVLVAFALAALGLDAALGWLVLWRAPEAMPTVLTLSGLLGFGVIASAVLLARDRLRGHAPARLAEAGARDAWFIVGWIAIELAVYFAMSPFPAARRLGGLVTAVLLLCGLALAARPFASPWPLRAAAAASALSGLVMLALSLVDATNVIRTVHEAAATMRANGAGHALWQLTGLNSDFYFRRERIASLDRAALGAGDLIAIDAAAPFEAHGFDRRDLTPVALVRAGTNLGVSVSTDFYRNHVPWRPAADARPAIAVFRFGRSLATAGE